MNILMIAAGRGTCRGGMGAGMVAMQGLPTQICKAKVSVSSVFVIVIYLYTNCMMCANFACGRLGCETSTRNRAAGFWDKVLGTGSVGSHSNGFAFQGTQGCERFRVN